MDFFVNEVSIHSQFNDMSSFRVALARLMSMRNLAGRFNHDMYCHRAILNAEVMPGVSMPRAIGRLPEAERRAAMFWLTRGGPFWDDLRQHGEDEYLECNDVIVTDTGIGEAAYRNIPWCHIRPDQRVAYRLELFAGGSDLASGSRRNG